MKKVLKALLIILLSILALSGIFLVFLTVTEYKPKDTEQIAVTGNSSGLTVRTDTDYSVVSWNIGYAGLDKNRDVIFDGGGNAPAPTREDVVSNLENMRKTLERVNADFLMLQEVDSDSSRSFSIDERQTLSCGNDAYAMNFSAPFVPYPVPGMIMKVHSGLFTTTPYDIESAARHALPCPFTWPTRAANLKRCMLVSYLPIEDSDRKLVLINIHLEAYSGKEARTKQAQMLASLIKEEFSKGNYVIAGGDWNEGMPGSLEVYPNTHRDIWECEEVDVSLFKGAGSVEYDNSTPSCRLLNQPYNPQDTVNTQLYELDGFVCSPNVQINSVKTLDEGFAFSDHNPVVLSFTLRPAN